jgi:hypothetical protein
MTKEEKQFTQEFLEKNPHCFPLDRENKHFKKHLLRDPHYPSIKNLQYALRMSKYKGPVYVLDFSDTAYDSPTDPNLIKWLSSCCSGEDRHPSEIAMFPCQYRRGEVPKNSKDGCNPYWRILLIPDIYDIELKLKKK